jgi:chromosome segregation ATPase
MKPIAIPIEELTLEQARAKLAACREHNAALAAELVTCTKEVAELRKEKVALLAELEPYRAQIALVSGC